MLIPSFQLKLQDRIQDRAATIGRYDGKHPCLTAATSGGKIFIHNPHSQGAVSEQCSYLNINKELTAVLAGRLDSDLGRDVLLVGTPTNLQCYDVEDNRDVFYREVPDGVSTLLVTQLSSTEPVMVIVGGNCSIQGYDMSGEEVFWTVTGDVVSAMAAADVTGDGNKELLVGSEDFDIRIFAHEDVIAETVEAEKVIGLVPIRGGLFGYSLVNGTIGMYDKTTRKWRVKSKHQAVDVCAFDLDSDGVPELISGWSNGRIEVRNIETGEVVYRDTMPCSVSTVMTADYRNDGNDTVVVCGSEGDVRGYLPTGRDDFAEASKFDWETADQQLQELSQLRQNLTHELSTHQQNMRATMGLNKSQAQVANIIPPKTAVTSELAVNKDLMRVELVVTTNNDTCVKGLIMFGEQLFEGESAFMLAKKPAQSLAVPLFPKKDIATTILVRALVGSKTSSIYHVFDIETALPRFAMYAVIEQSEVQPPPQGYARFQIAERVTRLVNWLSESFNVEPPTVHSNEVVVHFACLRISKPMSILMEQGSTGTTITIKVDDMDLCGDIIQDLATYVGVTELSSVADFPAEMEEFRKCLIQVDEHNATRLKLQAEVADASNQVKALVIKAEDARIVQCVAAMKKNYRKLYDLNRDLLNEHDKRATNHKVLMEALKDVNATIMKAARLRVGAPKTTVVNGCRNAIRENKIPNLFKVLREGVLP